MRETIYYQRGADDPILDSSVVLEIVRQFIPTAKEVRYIDESGGEGRTYAVDDTIILKVQRPQQLRSSTSLEKEAFFLQQLEKQADVNIPKVFGYGRRGSTEYICESRISGVAFGKLTLTEKERVDILFELGKTLRKIHSINQKPFIDCGLFPQDVPTDTIERLQLRFNSLVQKKNADLCSTKLDDALKYIENQLQIIKIASEYVALHSNPALTHTFVDETNHQFSGLIDFGDAYIGHPIFDLLRWNVSDRAMLFKGYISEKTVSDDFMRVYHVANNISTMIEEL